MRCLFSSLRSLRAQRSNLDVASDEKRDCRALWARNDDDNLKTLKRHTRVNMAKVLVLFISVFLILQPLQAAQRDRFVFAQLRYDGQWDPYPETWQDILEFLVTTTSIKPEAGRRVVTLEDE